VITRSAFKIHIATAAEYAGAAEGVNELERAIGKAKALGHDYATLESQLAEAKAGLRRFGEAHPRFEENGIGSDPSPVGDEPDGDNLTDGPGGWIAGSGAAGAKGQPPLEKTATSARGEAEAAESDGSSLKTNEMVEPAKQEGRGLPNGDVARRRRGNESQLNDMMEVQARRDGKEEALPVAAGASGPAAWDENLFRREFQEALRELIEEFDVLRAREEQRELEHEQGMMRQAEMAARLQWLEERARLNRDAR